MGVDKKSSDWVYGLTLAEMPRLRMTTVYYGSTADTQTVKP